MAGSEAPIVQISGPSRAAVFNMSSAGDVSVTLPEDAINADEIVDEPGVASIQTSSWASLSGSVKTVAARFIDAPVAGYVYVSATAVVEFDNRTNQGHYVKIALSELENAFSSHAQEFYVSIPGGEYGHYFETVTVTGIFEIDAGVHNFYLNAQDLAGEVRIGERQLNVMYFPTAHGSVDLDE
jgi:hypothetical protein